jgi:hypothetical protein
VSTKASAHWCSRSILTEKKFEPENVKYSTKAQASLTRLDT